MDLPLLQDTEEVGAWTAWDVTWRDVVILDDENVPVATVNVTSQDLGTPEGYAALKELLLEVARR